MDLPKGKDAQKGGYIQVGLKSPDGIFQKKVLSCQARHRRRNRINEGTDGIGKRVPIQNIGLDHRFGN
jgi:hypothetical protein